MSRSSTIAWRGTPAQWWTRVVLTDGARRSVPLDPTIPKSDEERARECARLVVEEVKRVKEVQ